MQAVDNSHLIGKRGQGYVEEESYSPDTTVWHTASDVIQSASGAPIWKFIELYHNDKQSLSKHELVDILNRIKIAGSTVSYSDTVANIHEERRFKENSTTIINLDYVPNFGVESKTLFTAEIKSDLNTKITFQNERGQIFVHHMKLTD